MYKQTASNPIITTTTTTSAFYRIYHSIPNDKDSYLTEEKERVERHRAGKQ
jgi:hypothetical protein